MFSVRKQFAVYIMASRSKTLYVGVTSNLPWRVQQHKKGLLSAFTRRYNVTRLVHYEPQPDALTAIRREKQIKGWRREKKLSLIESTNPDWADLVPPH